MKTMKRNFITAVVLAAMVLPGCTSEVFDEPAPAVDEAAMSPLTKVDVSKQDVMALSAPVLNSFDPRFSKGADGRWYPIDPDMVITGEELRTKIMGHGWESKYGTSADINPDGSRSRLGMDIGITGGFPRRFSVSPGKLTVYNCYPGGKTFPDGRKVRGYHSEAKLDTDADIISYAIGERWDEWLLMRMIDDNTLEAIKGSAYCIFEKVPAEELVKWQEQFDATFWDFHNY